MGHGFPNLEFERQLDCVTLGLKKQLKLLAIFAFFACWSQDIMEDIWFAISSILNLMWKAAHSELILHYPT